MCVRLPSVAISLAELTPLYSPRPNCQAGAFRLPPADAVKYLQLAAMAAGQEAG